MKTTRMISFVLGSTALATSMSFLPLADVHANAAPGNTLLENDDSYTQNVTRIAGNYENCLKCVINSESVTYHNDQFELVHGISFQAKKDASLASRTAPNKTVSGFTTTDLRDTARYAQAVYGHSRIKTDQDIQDFKAEGSTVHFVKHLKKDVSWIETAWENQDTALFVTKKDGTAVLSFKGSDRLHTWFSDIDALMTNHKEGGRYHNGFLKMYTELEASIWNHIMNFANQHDYSIEKALQKIRITGHSRGAGTAQIFADIARRKFGAAPEVILFAAPRALHKHTAGEYNAAAQKKTLNFAQAKDPVYYAALSAFNGGAHVGHKVFTALDNNHKAHGINGYRNMIDMMHIFDEVAQDPTQDNATTYKFEAYKEAPRNLSTEIDHSVQAYAESTISNLKNAAKTVVKTVVAPFKKAWGWFSK